MNLFYQSKHAIQRALLLRHANALLQEFWIANTSVFGDVNASRTGTSSFESRIQVWLKHHDLPLHFLKKRPNPFLSSQFECQLVDAHHCDPHNARANLVKLHHVRKTNWSYSSHTCFEQIGRANSIQIMVDCSMAIAGCNESSQIPTHPREEKKETSMR